MPDQTGVRKGSIFSIFLPPSIFLLHQLGIYGNLLFYDRVYILSVLYLLLPAALYALIRYMLKRSKDISLVCVFVLSVFFYFFEPVQRFLFSYPITFFLGKTSVLPWLFILPFVFLLVKQPKLPKLAQGLQLASLLFFLSEAMMLGINWRQLNKTFSPSDKVPLSAAAATQPADTLNVYHIIFDSYTNAGALQQIFHYRNPIDTFLINRGFYLARNTKSNYIFTPYSLSATLNLQYLDLKPTDLEHNFTNYLRGARLFPANPVFSFFNNRGYSVSHFSLLENYEYLDKLGTFVPQTPLHSLRNQTLERVFLDPWLWQSRAAKRSGELPLSVKENLRNYVQYNQEALQFLLKKDSGRTPHYTFIHFLLPHEPYVFLKPSVDSLTIHDVMDHKHGYIKQVEYANNLIRQFVPALQQDRRSIIIIQGDHGFREYDLSQHSRLLQSGALNAIYFPDRDYRNLYDSVSPVNTYRILFNQYFYQNLPLLKDVHILPKE